MNKSDTEKTINGMRFCYKQMRPSENGAINYMYREGRKLFVCPGGELLTEQQILERMIKVNV